MDDRRIARLHHELGDLDLAERLIRARGALVVAVPEPVARAHLRAIEVATAEPSRPPAPTWPHPCRPEVGGSPPGGGIMQRAVRLAAAATVVAFATIGGLAAAGSLPASAQNLVADAVARVGVDLPRASPPAGPPTDLPARTGEVPSERSDLPGTERRDDDPGTEHRERNPGSERRGDNPAVQPREQHPGAERRDDNPGAQQRRQAPDVEPREPIAETRSHDQVRGSSRAGPSPPPDDRPAPGQDAPRHTDRPATSEPQPAAPRPASPVTTSPPATSQGQLPGTGDPPGASSATTLPDQPPRRSERPAPRSGGPDDEPAPND